MSPRSSAPPLYRRRRETAGEAGGGGGEKEKFAAPSCGLIDCQEDGGGLKTRHGAAESTERIQRSGTD